MENTEWKEWIFALMTDAVYIERYPITEGSEIENLFAKGSDCDCAYEEVYEAKCRLCQRLGVQEDKDVEDIISNLLWIGKSMAMKMYDFGARFSSIPEKKEA